MDDKVERYPVPPEDLRWRVTGYREEAGWLATSHTTTAFFEEVLGKAGKSLRDFDAILDFGCGCGRVIRTLRNHTRPDAKLFGSDIDAEAIDWCKANIQDATFSVNGEYPPLPFADSELDLVYACSVFTHLDEKHQFAWLDELQRIVKPGGYLLLTFRHKKNIDEITNETVRKDVWAGVNTRGIYYRTTDFWKGVFPSWYGGAYHSPEYIRKNWGRYFELIRIEPAGAVAQETALFRCPRSPFLHRLKRLLRLPV